jgi:hypothetical protein
LDDTVPGGGHVPAGRLQPAGRDAQATRISEQRKYRPELERCDGPHRRANDGPGIPAGSWPTGNAKCAAADAGVHPRVGPDSAFIREVPDELGSDVLQSGGTIARVPGGATVANLDVNFVRWGPRDKPPGLLGTAAAALSVPRIVIGSSQPMSTSTAADADGFTALDVGALVDAALAMTPTMSAEAIWQTSIVTNDRVMLMLQEPVYIRGPDIPLYARAASLAPATSWSGEAPLATRVIRYDP